MAEVNKDIGREVCEPEAVVPPGFALGGSGGEKVAGKGGSPKAGDPAIAARVLADIRGYIPTLRERAAETERLGRVPEASIRELDAIGVFKMSIPVEYGGYALTPLQQLEIIAEVSRGCASTGWVVWVTQTSTQWIGFFSRQCREEVFATDFVGPRFSGSAAVPSPARRVPGGLMVKGQWAFVSGAHHTAYHYFAAVVPGDEKPQSLVVIVPHDSVVVLDDWHVMGMKGTSSNTVAIENEIFVPDHRIKPLAELFRGERSDPAPEGVLFQCDIGSPSACLHSGVGLGLAREAIDLFKKKIQTRKVMYSSYPTQAQSPVAHLQIGEMHCKLRAAELVARDNVERVQQRALEGKMPTDLDLKRIMLENGYVLQLASEITQIALRSSGASQIYSNSPFQRLSRDAQVATTHARTNIESVSEEYGRGLMEVEVAAVIAAG